MIKRLAAQRPAVCLCTGRTSALVFGLERAARKPAQFEALPGADLLEGAWPWAEMAAQVARTGCPAAVSYDAGQYVCESTYWSLLAFRQAFGYPAHAAFIHVPPLSEEMTAERIAAALASVLQARLEAMETVT